MHVLVLGGVSRSLINFRGPLISDMITAGHKVTACAGSPEIEIESVLETWNVPFIPLPLARASINPLGDMQTFLELRRIIREKRPDIVFTYTIKPVIWGGLAARSCGIENVFSLITGQGYALMDPAASDGKDSIKNSEQYGPAATANSGSQRTDKGTSPGIKQRLAGSVAKRLYKASLKHSQKVFFQNPDDAKEFIRRKLVVPRKSFVVSGSGIDLDHFKTEYHSQKTKINDKQTTEHSPQTRDLKPRTGHQEPGTHPRTRTHAPVFLLIARLLREKGIYEYAEAAACIKKLHTEVEFHLVGYLERHPSGLEQGTIDAWVKAGTLIYHGYQPDVRPFLRSCSVYVLPSFYREGTPRSILEAMATGRPIITTDAPGCRETVRLRGGQSAYCRHQVTDFDDHDTPNTDTQERFPIENWLQHAGNTNLIIGENGILIPPRNGDALAEAIRFFIEHPEQIAIMGRASRQYAEDRYDVRKVNAVMLREMGLVE